MNRLDWIDMGVKNGWCTEVRCVTHDGPTDYEKYYEDDDICWFVLELKDDD